MERFPRTEPEILILAEMMAMGLIGNTALYPAPPVSVLDLRKFKNDYIVALNAANAARAAAEAASAAKDDALEELTDAMKSNICYAENTAEYDADKLKLIGWTGGSEGTAMAAPGKARLLEVPRQGDGWLILDWKSPADGGTPSAYKIMRRERPAGMWEDAATTVITEATLVEQPKVLELEYSIIAVNKAGEGTPSNTQMVVL